jgi:hypothetical protein
VKTAIVFVPSRGTLTARMFENLNNGIANSLVYNIAIPVQCVLAPSSDPDGVDQRRTAVSLDFIRIGFVDWRDLPGRVFTFPVNPAAGYVDGSVYFDGAHQYADLTRLSFGALTGATMPTVATITFHFYKNSAWPTLPETASVDWDINLAVDATALDQVMAEAGTVLGARS